MLATLHIENIAVAKSVDVDFTHGFTVFTGETGAGKSIIVDSINLVIGGRFRSEMLRTGENEAMVSGYFTDVTENNLKLLAEMGVFPDEDGCFFVQRNFRADGKSQNRLNGRQIPVSLLRSVTELLVNIHGQHDNQKLLDPSSHLG
ncbi:MAG: AAA family ATPase, partial [Clostridia bacterium]|nr:AAA family ATPase [Clostridia bacterium]